MKINILIITCFVLLTQLVSAIDIGSQTLADSDFIDGVVNEFFTSDSNRLGLLIPAILLVVTIICFSIDFGAVGVSAASALSLLVLFMLKIVYFHPFSLASFILIIVIMIYKISR